MRPPGLIRDGWRVSPGRQAALWPQTPALQSVRWVLWPLRGQAAAPQGGSTSCWDTPTRAGSRTRRGQDSLDALHMVGTSSEPLLPTACILSRVHSPIGALSDIPCGGHDNSLHRACLENPWTEEPRGIRSTGSQRVGHD